MMICKGIEVVQLLKNANVTAPLHGLPRGLACNISEQE